MGGILIEEDLLVKYSIIDSKTPEGKKIHEFLLGRAKALAGRYIDFDKNPITFLLSDVEEPNAFFAPAFDPKNRPRRDDHKTVSYIRNPIPTPVICITRGLLDMVDNLDQLDFILGHELTHWLMRSFGIRHNSKGEEGIADLHSVDLMYDAGADPKQALVMHDKISAYAKAKKDEESKYERRSRRDEEEEGVDWSSILDVHASDSNRKTGIEASLTRLSHLIDDRMPTAIDKERVTAQYSDPIDAFLVKHNYKARKAIGKLKLLVDCIEHISTTIPPEEFFVARFKEDNEEDPDEWDYLKERRKQELQMRVEAGYPDYYKGPTIIKKYQQKITNLAEGVIEEVGIEREKSGNQQKPAAINTIDLNIYLQNRAYQHIAKYGYPAAGDSNYSLASGILYSYFYAVFSEYSRRWDKRRDEEAVPISRPRIEDDIDTTKRRIKAVRTGVEFQTSEAEYQRLTQIRQEIISVGSDGGRYARKLDNLSGFSSYGHRGRSEWDARIYSEPRIGKTVAWNNLVDIAIAEPSAKDEIVKFLGEHNIQDYRITHGLPYVRIGYGSGYEIGQDGKIIRKDVPDYELDFATNRDVVLDAYEYIRSYFENESTLIEETCYQASSVGDSDYIPDRSLKDEFNDRTVAEKKVYDFMSMFNALPEEEKEGRSRWRDQEVLALIPERFRTDYPMPGGNEKGRFTLNNKLLYFDNPIFIAHFGEDFKDRLVERKKAHQQKMFDAAFALLQQSVDRWLDVHPKKEALKEKVDTLQREIWNIPREEQATRASREEKELRLWQEKLNFYSKKAELSAQLIMNILFSIFSRDGYFYHLNRLTDDQKKILARYVVQDEKACMLQIFNPEQYERFCDYLGILEGQTEQAISGNYELTEDMQAVARNYGYNQADDSENLSAFVQENAAHKYRGCKDYAWYLHAFDTMRYLENNTAININDLLTTMSFIAEEDRGSNGQDVEGLIRARHSNYIKLIEKSKLLALVSEAINDPENYKDLSFEEIIDTADNMISASTQIARVVVKRERNYYSSDEKVTVEPQHQAVRDIFEKNTYDLLRQAEQMALEESNPLEKMVKLYALYCQKSEYYSSDPKRSGYLDRLNKDEGRLKQIASLAENPSFWPDDVLDHVKAFVFAKKVFLDDKEFEDRLLNDILDKLDKTPSGRQKNECLYILLDKSLRAAFPETRDRLFDIYAQGVAERLGKDDGSQQYQRRLAVYLKALDDTSKKEWDIAGKYGHRDGLLDNSIAVADRYILLRRVSDLIVSQEQTSEMLKKACQVSLNSEDMMWSYLYGIGVDYLTARMDKDPEMARQFIKFTNSKGEKSDCEEISAYIEAALREDYKDRPDRIIEILPQIDAGKCKILYENFWSAPLEARAVIISRVLKSAVNSEEKAEDDAQHDWEKAFDVVMDNLIHPDDTSIEAKYARDIMHSYIKSRSDYERVIIISAMMVANRNIGADAGNIGKALRLFLENMGPAEIKLGQAIASHPDTPESIRKELQHLKSAANMPARWTVYDWIKAENIPEELWKGKYLGEIMGSASYYTSIALGEEEVLRILRPEAREKATKGFRVIGSTVEDLRAKEGTTDLSYRELTHSVQEMVTQAGRMSEIETDHDLGQQQYETAKSLCDDVTLTSGDKTFTLKVMDWRARGKNWIIMDKAKGVTYNSLPEETAEQIAYKKNFAKGYILFEITNILSGGRFDHDKHGDQLSVDTTTDIAGLYDTGAMALEDPSSEEQKCLGLVLHNVLKASMGGEDIVSAFGRVTSEQIEELHRKGQDTQYLVEVKKGILALGDFFKILNEEDIKEIFSSINFVSDLSTNVQEGMTESMSFFERAHWKAFLAIQSVRESSIISIRRNPQAENSQDNVVKFTVAPTILDKSAWLQATFNGGNNKPSGISNAYLFCSQMVKPSVGMDAKVA